MREIRIPELAESITEGTIAKWLVKEGDQIKKEDPVLELETDKVNLEINGDVEGIVREIAKKEGADVRVGDVVAIVDSAGHSAGADQEVNQGTHNKQADEKLISRTVHVPATPSARRKARESGIDLNEVKASFGPLRVHDVDQYKRESEKTEQTAVKQPYEQEESQPAERIKMTRRRQTIAKRLVAAQQQAAMLTTFNEIDLDQIMKLRKERKEAFYKKHGIKLGLMSFFTKAAVTALKEFPLLNAEIDDDELIIKKYYDIGIAVSAEEGLVVPVVRKADQLDFAGIEREISRLSEKVRENTVELEDLKGGTFTITNGGVFGSLLSTPILNAPQVAILGMHTIQQRPVVLADGSIEARPMMYTALSYDHRIVDGKEAVQFLVRIKALLEDPLNLLLES